MRFRNCFMSALVLPEAMYHWSITHILQYLILWGVHRRCITRFTKPMTRALLLVIGPWFWQQRQHLLVCGL